MNPDNAKDQLKKQNETPVEARINKILNAFMWSVSYTLRQYILLGIAPAFLLAIVLTLIASTVSIPGGYVGNLLVLVFGWFIPFVSIFYPYVKRMEESQEVRENFHLFITHFTALTISNVDRMEVFRRMANEDYGVISREMERVTILVDSWNMSLDEAALIVSKNSPSDLLSGFMERLSYNLSSGQSMHEFVADEQESIFESYTARYKSDLDRLELFANSYLSLMIGLTFAVIFGLIAPMLIQFTPLILLSGILGGYVMSQLLFGLIIQSISPEDYLWYRSGNEKSDLLVKKNIATGIGIGLTILAFGTMITIGWLSGQPFGNPTGIPYQVWIWLTTLPSLFAGIYIWALESRVQEMDSQYPGFIRGVGATEYVKNSSTASVLRDIRTKDFGALSVSVIKLYRRLKSRFNQRRAWHKFSADTGSYMIDRFTEMYREGRNLGANTRDLGLIISRNFNNVLNLRKHREQANSTLVSLSYGVVAVSSFAFFVGVTIMNTMLGFRESIEANNDGDSPGIDIVSFAGYNISQIEIMMVSAIILTSVASAVIIRISQRKSMGGAMLHFSLMILLAMTAGFLVEQATDFIEVLE